MPNAGVYPNATGGPSLDHAQHCLRRSQCHEYTHVLVVPVLRSCQSPTWIWRVNYLHLHLHLHVRGESGFSRTVEVYTTY